MDHHRTIRYVPRQPGALTAALEERRLIIEHPSEWGSDREVEKLLQSRAIGDCRKVKEAWENGCLKIVKRGRKGYRARPRVGDDEDEV